MTDNERTEELKNAESIDLAQAAVKLLLSKKGIDVKMYDVREYTSITDYYVNVTARSSTHDPTHRRQKNTIEHTTQDASRNNPASSVSWRQSLMVSRMPVEQGLEGVKQEKGGRLATPLMIDCYAYIVCLNFQHLQ